MEKIEQALEAIGAANGLEIALDENGACALELAGGRVMLLQERADVEELDFVAALGPVPVEARAAVFTELLSANFYWQETYGATISWNADIEEAVLIYPLALAGATPESIEEVFARFVDLQNSWADRLAAIAAGAMEDAGGGAADEDGEDVSGEEAADASEIINP